MDRARLRQIIKEELSRAVNEGDVTSNPVRVGYKVAVKDAGRAPGSIEIMQDEAFEAAVARAEADYPGYEWELRRDFKGDTGMHVYRSPQHWGDNYTFTVRLMGTPGETDVDLMPGGERLNYERERNDF